MWKSLHLLLKSILFSLEKKKCIWINISRVLLFRFKIVALFLLYLNKQKKNLIKKEILTFKSYFETIPNYFCFIFIFNSYLNFQQKKQHIEQYHRVFFHQLEQSKIKSLILNFIVYFDYFQLKSHISFL